MSYSMVRPIRSLGELATVEQACEQMGFTVGSNAWYGCVATIKAAGPTEKPGASRDLPKKDDPNMPNAPYDPGDSGDYNKSSGYVGGRPAGTPYTSSSASYKPSAPMTTQAKVAVTAGAGLAALLLLL